MSNRPVAFFTTRYSKDSLFVRKKSGSLAVIAMGLGLVGLVFASFMIATKALELAAVYFGLASLCIAALALLRFGKYRAASSVFLYGLLAALFLAIKLDQNVNAYGTYAFGALACFLLILAALVAERPIQAVLIGVLDLAAIEALYWIDSFPKDGNVVTALAIRSLSLCSLMIAMGATVAAYLVSITGGAVRNAESKAVAAERGLQEMSAAMGRAQASSQNMGELLSSSAASTSEAIASLRVRVEGIAGGMDELTVALAGADEKNKRTADRRRDVKDALAAYSDQVARASAAIEEMAAITDSLMKQASSKKEAVRELVDTSTRGEQVLASMGQSMEKIQESAKRVMDLSAIIGDVADRTNLLGMNASIEAAHAGAAGKGFAVVANEIRSLSVETGKSARVIADTLKESQTAIASTAARSGEALASFKKITEDIRGVSLMIEELLSSIQELSSGSADVVSAVEAVADLTQSTEVAVDRSAEGFDESLKGMETVVGIAMRVRGEASEMSKRLGEIREDSDEVRKLAAESRDAMQAQGPSLAGVARKGGAQASPSRVPLTRGIRIKADAK